MRIEPNMLLAVTTANALALLIASATLFGAPGQLLKYLIIAVAVPAAAVPLNRMWRKKMGWSQTAMIHPMAAATAVWAAIFPAMITLMAVIPFVWPSKDYGLLVLIGSIWFGLTVDSALIARRTARS
ncbi:MAG: hypothetical protein ACRYFE_00460 [Janthinobacterium lividum]